MTIRPPIKPITFKQLKICATMEYFDIGTAASTKVSAAYFALAPVHIVTGSAGCQEGRDHFKHNPYKWSAFRSQDFGYTKFKAFNKTHVYLEQVSVDLAGRVIDSFWLVKNSLSFADP